MEFQLTTLWHILQNCASTAERLRIGQCPSMLCFLFYPLASGCPLHLLSRPGTRVFWILLCCLCQGQQWWYWLRAWMPEQPAPAFCRCLRSRLLWVVWWCYKISLLDLALFTKSDLWNVWYKERAQLAHASLVSASLRCTTSVYLSFYMNLVQKCFHSKQNMVSTHWSREEAWRRTQGLGYAHLGRTAGECWQSYGSLPGIHCHILLPKTVSSFSYLFALIP